jgi:hypothetical protein
MFRLTRVIVRLRSEPLNVFNDYVHFGIPQGLGRGHSSGFLSDSDPAPAPAPAPVSLILTAAQ